eukprot:CAMPEP_0117664222 /NCGR_PEP_ID=MMETSP0804-20121206/9089_1 /TAXON_ID=1074897 /ORGANISM="Tetraselmis astigmatica, Strain CCMP880" /LENGTH=52 /DNA_ID=CAMNT_0005471409 /DNA_START=135 /DNA_END=293 /DNA_ORIENTATION=+
MDINRDPVYYMMEALEIGGTMEGEPCQMCNAEPHHCPGWICRSLPRMFPPSP